MPTQSEPVVSSFSFPFTIQPPIPGRAQVTGVSPDRGPSLGSVSVKLTGTDLYGPAEVTFGTVKVYTGGSLQGGTTLTVTPPAVNAATAGAVQATVKTPFGVSDPFTYT